jgi:hypothetical protein
MYTQTDALLTELQNLNDELDQISGPNSSTTLTTVSSSLSSTQILPLSGTISPALSAKSVPTPFQLTQDNLDEFILKNSQDLIQNSLIAIHDLKDVIGKTFDGKLITSFAEMVKATTGAIDTLNSIQLEKNKQKMAKTLKEMDIESRKNLKTGPSKVVNNNVLVATREEVFKMLSQDEPLNPVESRLIEPSDNNQPTGSG